MDQPGKVFNPARARSAEQGNRFSLSPFAPENLVSRDGFAVSSRVSLLILHIQAGSGAYSRDFSRFPRGR